MKRRAAIAAVVAAVLLVWWSSTSDDPQTTTPTTTVTTAVASASTTTVTTTAGTGTSSDDKSTDSQSRWPENASQTERDALRDGVPEEIARLSYGERVDEKGTATVDGFRFVLSVLPTDTRNRFVDEGVAGPDLDPLGGEVLLIEDDTIVRAYEMNQFPPSELASDDAFVYAIRRGDGGYPDSALLAINPRTLKADRIVMIPGGQPPAQTYPEIWERGSTDQLFALAQGDYRGALRAIHSKLSNGDVWTVRDDPDLGLCVSIASIDYGCDESDTVMYVAAPLPPEGLDLNAIDILTYGYLPEEADGVEFYFEGTRIDLAAEIDTTLGLWAAPLTVGNDPFSVRFISGAGGETVSEWPLEN